jgi:thiopeptide-type bacteriocin biosynthesis protein
LREADACFYKYDNLSDEWVYYIIDVTHYQQNEILLALYRNGLDEFNYWFMRKKFAVDHIRLRIKKTKGFREESFEDKLSIMKCSFHKTIYEPELFLFGGEIGLGIAHEYFCFMSKIYLEILKIEQSNKHLNLVNISINNYFVKKVLDDQFEVWDCWNRVFELRKFEIHKYEKLIEHHKKSIELIIEQDPVKLIPESLRHYFVETLEHLISRFRNAVSVGTLDRGSRSIISCLIIFGWNIFALKPGIQGGIAASFTKIYEP